MNKQLTRMEAEVVIAGAGPGGCTLAKDLSAKGKKVILLEKGGDNDFLYGTPLGMLLNIDVAPRFPMPTRGTNQGENVVVGSGLGGGTLFYAGSAFLPDADYWKAVGIEFSKDIIDEAVKETWSCDPPEDFIGPGSRRIHAAARGLGYPFELAMRHVDFSKCLRDCDKCVLGCTRDAKWTGKVFARAAQKNGATILTRVKADHVILEQGRAVGLRARGVFDHREYEVRAPVVVCASGGVGTVNILKNSGFNRAGSWFSGDPTTFIFGFLPRGEKGNGGEHSMTYGWYDEAHHIIWCGMASPALAWHLMFIQDEWARALPKLGRYSRVLSLFAKCSDDGVGRVYMNGQIDNFFTEADRERQEYGRMVGRQILIEAGCDPYDIHVTGVTLGHPSGTVRIGELLDADLQIRGCENLYCCDTSVTPGAPGRPPTLSIVALGKRLARHLEASI